MIQMGDINWKRFSVIVGLIWIVQAAYSVLNTGLIQQYSGRSPRWLAISIYSFDTAITWALITPFLLYIIIRLNNRNLSISQLIATYVVIGLIIATIQRYIDVVLSYNLIIWTEAIDLSLLKWSNFMGLNFVRHVGNGLIVYFIIVGILYGYLFYNRSQKSLLKQAILEGELSTTKLEVLKYQFQPHFLFNSLQSVSTLMRRDVNIADEALGGLGDLLRHSIKTLDVDRISLGDELFYLQKYIDIQKTRYQGKLSSNVIFNKELVDLQVPPFLLQPIVENSIKHGLEKTGKATTITISITKNDKMIIIKCSDNGISNDNNKLTNGMGTGLNNLRMRLEALYGEKLLLTYGHDKNIGYKTTINIPLYYKL